MMTTRTIALLLVLWLAVSLSSASALTNTTATIQWTPTTDATIRYELRWSHFANGWQWTGFATNLDSTVGQYLQTYPAFLDTPAGEDRGVCWDARATQAGRTPSTWLSTLNQQVCAQMPVASAPTPTPVPVPTPPPPTPLPVPVPSGLVIASATPDTVVIVASLANCRRVLTSTAGTTTAQQKRTLTCIR